LRGILTPERWATVNDPRKPRGVRFRLVGLLNLLVLGLTVGSRALRDVERLGKKLAVGRAFGLRGSPTDTTLYTLVRGLSPMDLTTVLVEQVKELWLSKRMQVDPAIGISLVAIDGKCLGADRERKHPESTAVTVKRRSGSTRRSKRNSTKVSRARQGNLSVPDMEPGPDGKVHLVKALRAVHVASATKVAMMQAVIPAHRGEAPMFERFVRELVRTYGRAMVQCVSVDAGFVTIKNLMMMAVLGIHYIAALKGNAGYLHRRLSKEMGQDTDAPPPGGWIVETTERRNKTLVHRQFGRLEQLGDCMDGDYRQVWRQRTTFHKAGEPTKVDDRLFITSLRIDRLTPEQCMAAIRAHWGIENDCFWTLDTQWDEDTRAWVRKGLGRETLAVLRLIAYNIVRVVRHRVLRDGESQANDGASRPPPHNLTRKKVKPFREVMELLRDALVMPGILPIPGGT
jgi:predicted transposase YbfD/YdcC